MYTSNEASKYVSGPRVTEIEHPFKNTMFIFERSSEYHEFSCLRVDLCHFVKLNGCFEVTKIGIDEILICRHKQWKHFVSKRSYIYASVVTTVFTLGVISLTQCKQVDKSSFFFFFFFFFKDVCFKQTNFRTLKCIIWKYYLLFSAFASPETNETKSLVTCISK